MPALYDPDEAPAGASEIAAQLEDLHRPPRGGQRAGLRAYALADFLALDIPTRGHVLHPVIPTQGLVMLVAPRGVGKTFLALTVAYAIATGSNALGWTAPQPRKVLFLDGEMPARTMQERLARIVRGMARQPPTPDGFRLVTPDLCGDMLPNLSDPDGQAAIDAILGDAEVIVVDNLSAWCRSGGENEADRWQVMQDWLLNLRRRGKTVIIIHHAGKGGDQRGTSRREDVLDTVITLTRPPDYRPSEGARFYVHITKCRNETGAALDPFEAVLTADIDGAVWITRPIEEIQQGMVVEAARNGLSIREIAEELGLSRSAVGRILKTAREDGRLPPEARRNQHPHPSGRDRKTAAGGGHD